MLAAVYLVPVVESSVFVGFVLPGEIAVLIGSVVANEGSLRLWAVIGLLDVGACPVRRGR